MFARLKTAIARLRRKKAECSDADYDVSYPPEDDVLRQRLEESKNEVKEFLEPIETNWEFIEDTLLWKNRFPACICFFLISGIFWKFIGMKFRKTVLILGAFLLANGISGDIRATCWDFCQTNLHLQVKEERLLFDFDELCLGIALIWTCYSHSVQFFQDLKTNSSSKFYCILAVFLFGVLTLFTYFPVIEFIYILVCGLFFYPSLYHYGIMDRLEARFNFLTEPVIRHWENNRTKRMRDSLGSNFQDVHVDDTDDEFLPDRNAFTTGLSSIGDGENINVVNNETLSYRLMEFKNEDTEDEEDDFDESHFVHGLSLPSMSNFDSMMEPYDEFHSGLRFPDVNESSRMDTENILNAAANNLDTDDEDIDDLPYEDEADSARRREQIAEGPRHGPLCHPTIDHEIRQRHKRGPKKVTISKEPEQESKKQDLSPRQKSEMKAVETEFEFLDHADHDGMDEYNEMSSDPPANQNPPNEQTTATYTQAGIDSVSKFLGLK